MTKRKMYRYIGYNGVLTTPILLAGIEHLELIELRADGGHYLTNGIKKVYSIMIQPNDMKEWVEVEGMIE